MSKLTTLEMAKDYLATEKKFPDEPIDMKSWEVRALAKAVIQFAKASEFAWFPVAETKNSDLAKLRKILREIGAAELS